MTTNYFLLNLRMLNAGLSNCVPSIPLKVSASCRVENSSTSIFFLVPALLPKTAHLNTIRDSMVVLVHNSFGGVVW